MSIIYLSAQSAIPRAVLVAGSVLHVTLGRVTSRGVCGRGVSGSSLLAIGLHNVIVVIIIVIVIVITIINKL